MFSHRERLSSPPFLFLAPEKLLLPAAIDALLARRLVEGVSFAPSAGTILFFPHPIILLALVCLAQVRPQDETQQVSTISKNNVIACLIPSTAQSLPIPH
jgi:hypothetical protein